MKTKRWVEASYFAYGMALFTVAMYFRDWQPAIVMGASLLAAGLIQILRKPKVVTVREELPAEIKQKLTHDQRLRLNGGSHTPNEWRLLCMLNGWRCARCHKQKPLTKDHIVPVIQGGKDDITNIQPLCRECNSSKNGRAMSYGE